MRGEVAEMPGYPTRKLLFGGPETRTKAVVMLGARSSSVEALLAACHGPSRWIEIESAARAREVEKGDQAVSRKVGSEMYSRNARAGSLSAVGFMRVSDTRLRQPIQTMTGRGGDGNGQGARSRHKRHAGQSDRRQSRRKKARVGK